MVKGYASLTDNKLLKMYHAGDEEAFNEILVRYKDMVKMRARLFFLRGGDTEDLIQEGMIGLFEAVISYKDDKNTEFITFANRCVRSKMIKAVQSDNKKSNGPLNNSIPLDTIESGEEHKEGESGEVYPRVGESNEEKFSNPEDIVMDREDVKLFIDEMSRRLSKMESEVFHYFIGGMDYKEIASVMKKTPKSIDNALHRILAKASDLMLTKEE